MKYVLDTTAFSALMRHEDKILRFLGSHSPKDIQTVPPVVAEIHYGIERLQKESKKYMLLKAEMERLLSVLDVLPWTSKASYWFGVVKSKLEKDGKLIDDFDIAIGAIAMAHDCCVITRNIQHFGRIEGLKSMSLE